MVLMEELEPLVKGVQVVPLDLVVTLVSVV